MKKVLVIIGAILMAGGFFGSIIYFILTWVLDIAIVDIFNCCCGWIIYLIFGIAFLVGLILLIVGFVMSDKPKTSAGPAPPPPPAAGSPPPPPPPPK